MIESQRPRSQSRRADVPLLLFLGSITVPLFGAGAYVLLLDLALSMKATLTFCIAAIAVPMAVLMGYIVANPIETDDAQRPV